MLRMKELAEPIGAVGPDTPGDALYQRFEDEPGAEAEPEPVVPGAASGIRVLVADDHSVNRRVVELVLAAAGAEAVKSR
jgi:hypothetical protein